MDCSGLAVGTGERGRSLGLTPLFDRPAYRQAGRTSCVPPIGGTVYSAGQPPGTASGGGRGGIPNGMPQGRLRASLHTAGRSAGGIPAPPTGGASTGGRFLGTPMGVLCEPPRWAARFLAARCTAAGFGGGNGAAPLGGTVYRRAIAPAEGGGGWQGPVGALQRTPGGVLFRPADRQAGWHPAELLPGRHVYGK